MLKTILLSYNTFLVKVIILSFLQKSKQITTYFILFKNIFRVYIKLNKDTTYVVILQKLAMIQYFWHACAYKPFSIELIIKIPVENDFDILRGV